MTNVVAFPRRRYSVGSQAPRWPFTLNKDSPLAHGLTHLWTHVRGSRYMIDLVGGVATASNSPVAGIRGGFEGIYYTSVSNNGTTIVGGGVGNIAVNDISIGWLSYLDGFATGSYPFIANVKNPGATEPWALFYSDDASYSDITWGSLETDTGGNEKFAVPSGISVSGEWHWGVGLFDASASAGNRFTAYLNGRSMTATAPGAIGSQPNTTQLGSRAGGLLDFTGVIKHIAVWNRKLSSDEAIAWYRPQTRWDLYSELGRVFYSIPTAAAAGGNLLLSHPPDMHGGMMQ